jgi:Fn3 associated
VVSVTVVLGPKGASHYYGSVHVVAAVFPPSPCATTIYHIEEATETCSVTYTLDGSTPTASSFPYSRPIQLGVGVWTVKVALWSDSDLLVGDIISQTFTVVPKSRSIPANDTLKTTLVRCYVVRMLDGLLCGQVPVSCSRRAHVSTTHSTAFRTASTSPIHW